METRGPIGGQPSCAPSGFATHPCKGRASHWLGARGFVIGQLGGSMSAGQKGKRGHWTRRQQEEDGEGDH